MKDVSQVSAPDPRMAVSSVLDRRSGQVWPMDLKTIHSGLATASLDPAVPADVREQFEIARNLALYSWFVYEFSAVAQMWSLLTLEMALRRRFNAPSGSSAPSLTALLRRASEEGIFTDEDLRGSGLPAPLAREEQRELSKTGRLESPLTGLERALDFLAWFRNELGHGNRLLGADVGPYIHTMARLCNRLFSTE